MLDLRIFALVYGSAASHDVGNTSSPYDSHSSSSSSSSSSSRSSISSAVDGARAVQVPLSLHNCTFKYGTRKAQEAGKLHDPTLWHVSSSGPPGTLDRHVYAPVLNKHTLGAQAQLPLGLMQVSLPGLQLEPAAWTTNVDELAPGTIASLPRLCAAP